MLWLIYKEVTVLVIIFLVSGVRSNMVSNASKWQNANSPLLQKRFFFFFFLLVWDCRLNWSTYDLGRFFLLLFRSWLLSLKFMYDLKIRFLSLYLGFPNRHQSRHLFAIDCISGCATFDHMMITETLDSCWPCDFWMLEVTTVSK